MDNGESLPAAFADLVGAYALLLSSAKSDEDRKMRLKTHRELFELIGDNQFLDGPHEAVKLSYQLARMIGSMDTMTEDDRTRLQRSVDSAVHAMENSLDAIEDGWMDPYSPLTLRSQLLERVMKARRLFRFAKEWDGDKMLEKMLSMVAEIAGNLAQHALQEPESEDRIIIFSRTIEPIWDALFQVLVSQALADRKPPAGFSDVRPVDFMPLLIGSIRAKDLGYRHSEEGVSGLKATLNELVTSWLQSLSDDWQEFDMSCQNAFAYQVISTMDQMLSDCWNELANDAIDDFLKLGQQEQEQYLSDPENQHPFPIDDILEKFRLSLSREDITPQLGPVNTEQLKAKADRLISASWRVTNELLQ